MLSRLCCDLGAGKDLIRLQLTGRSIMTPGCSQSIRLWVNPYKPQRIPKIAAVSLQGLREKLYTYPFHAGHRLYFSGCLFRHIDILWCSTV